MSRDRDQRAEMVRARAKRSFVNSEEAQQAFRQYRALVGDRNVVDDLARSAYEKLDKGEILTPEELRALAQAIAMTRPAVRWGQKRKDVHEQAGRLFNGWKEIIEGLEKLVWNVGQVQCRNKPLGTCFLIDNALAVTNRHVADKMTGGTGQLLPSDKAAVDFEKCFGHVSEHAPVPVESIVALDDTADLCLLRLDPHAPSAATGALRLSDRAPLTSDTVIVVGYPLKDGTQDSFLKETFAGVYGVKYLAPGMLTAVHPTRLFHDCSTLHGNSGSPLLCAETLEVIGVHAAGAFTFRNEAVSVSELRRFLAEQGV